jgi:hypothetical protein
MPRYEYRWLFKSASPGASAERPIDYFRQSVLHELWEGIEEALPTPDGDDWEIVSHDLFFAGGRVVATYLLRRPIPTAPQA